MPKLEKDSQVIYSSEVLTEIPLTSTVDDDENEEYSDDDVRKFMASLPSEPEEDFDTPPVFELSKMFVNLHLRKNGKGREIAQDFPNLKCGRIVMEGNGVNHHPRKSHPLHHPPVKKRSPKSN